MKYLSRSVAALVFTGLAAHTAQAQTADETTPPAATYMAEPASEFVMPPATDDAGISMPAAVPASTPVPAAAPAKVPAAIVPAEQSPAPVIVVPSAETAPVAAPFAPASTPAKVKSTEPRPHAIPLINTRQHTEVNPDVTYVTGGIGDDELESIKASKGDYNTYVMSASLNGAFVGDAHVVITDKAGKVMLDVVAGPLLYVKLPAGSYVLDANLGEQKKHQAFTIGKKTGTANVHLGWKVEATLSN